MLNSEHFQTALILAKQRKGFTAPNPAVGAVVVKDGQIVGRGHHIAAGQAHAEVMALQQAGASAKGGDLYITLEPCCHIGKTPPCTDAIIAAEISRVFYSEPDPNPLVRGLSAGILSDAGISCTEVPQPEIQEFYRSYRYVMKHQRPFMTAKIALSFDGKIAGKQGESVQLTGSEAQRFTHEQRLLSDAILTTSHTVTRDNPQLNVRLGDQTVKKPVYILARDADVSPDCQLTKTSFPLTVLHGPDASREQLIALKSNNIICQELPANEDGMILTDVMQYLAERGHHDIWIEAGGRLLQQCLLQNVLSAAYFYIAPRTLGNTATSAFTQAFDFNQLSHKTQWKILGNDAVCYVQFVEI